MIHTAAPAQRTTPRIALASGIAPTQDDDLLIRALHYVGISASRETWFDRSTRWNEFDAVVITTCWGYQHRLDEFLRWIGSLEQSGCAVINDPSLLRWNSSKRYLLEVANWGVLVPSTTVIAAGTPSDQIARTLASLSGYPMLVAKPAVSGNGEGTFRIPASPSSATALADAAAHTEFLLQPFLPEVQLGELSLVFFDGVFSHAVRKIPAPQEFRVQTVYGGRVEIAIAASSCLDTAAKIIERLPGRPVYARIDGIPTDAGLVLMEIEVIEPDLFLVHAPASAGKFARAIARALHTAGLYTAPAG